MLSPVIETSQRNPKFKKSTRVKKSPELETRIATTRFKMSKTGTGSKNEPVATTTKARIKNQEV